MDVRPNSLPALLVFRSRPMSMRPPVPSTARPPTSAGVGWKVWAPLLAVVCLLLALWLVPVWIDRQARLMRARSARSAQGAHAELNAITAQLTLMAASARGFALTTDVRFREDFRAADAAQEQSFARLSTLTRSLDSAVLHDVLELHARTDAWDAVAEDLFGGRLTRDAYLQHLPDQQEQLRRLLAALASIEAAVDREANRDVADALRIERLSMLGTGALTALVILGILSLFLIARRFRELAVETGQLAAVAEERRQLVEQAMHSRAELIRGVSHDVQNPITAADLLLELLQTEVEGPVPSGQQNVLASVRRSLDQASTILSEILELAQAESGALRIEPAPVELPTLLREWHADSQAAATAAGLTLHAELDTGLPIIHTDPRRVRRILDNFLSNAIKYASRGGWIAVRVELARVGPAGVDQADSWIRLQLRDSGPGIAPEVVEHLFTEFYRAPGTHGRGTGIGLAISRKVARLLSGEITVESELGTGSTFTLWIPVR